jgi:hypothetical protein
MKRNFTLAIPTPCHENWNQLTPTQKGRFCGSCQKEVIDFTKWNEDQIKDYFFNKPKSTCGRFAPHQLTTYKNHSHTNSIKQTRMAASLAFILLLISRPTEAQVSKSKMSQEQVDKKADSTIAQINSVTRIIIKGVVVGEENDSIPGVNVIRKGTTQGTVTDGDGKFEMVIHNPKSIETLVTSFIGFTTIEHEVVADSVLKEIKIIMYYDTVALNEAVIAGGITLGGVVASRWYSPRSLWWRVKSIFRR